MRLLAVVGGSLVLLMTSAPPCLADDEVRMVYPGADGKLVYTLDERGNRIPDFSRAGYKGGGVALPEVPVVVTLTPEPGDGDDTKRVQEAVAKVSAMKPNEDGYRGAVLLKRGTYRIAGRLNVAASGVVLRGEGQGPDGTTLLATGKEKRTLIVVSGRLSVSEVAGTRHSVSAVYVPWGADTFPLDSTRQLSAGDTVMVVRPGTAEWVHELKMDQIVAKPGLPPVKQWKPGEYTVKFERTVVAIDGNTIRLDGPVVDAMEQKLGGGYVYRYTESGRIENSGIESLRLVSEYEKGKENEDEAHAWIGVALDDCRNSWARNVTTAHFSSAVRLGRETIHATVQDCSCLAPVSLITGMRRYPFTVFGQFCLVQRCYSNHSRHAEATGDRVAGPNVFLDCLAENTHADTGPHHRWATGILWDNLKGGAQNAEDRGYLGSGHGWAGALQVFWNCEPSAICVQKPPTSQNYAIGCTGKIFEGWLPTRTQQPRPPGHYESQGRHVNPRSLYLKQLEDRLGPGAVVIVTTEDQRKGAVYDALKANLSR